MIETVHLNLKSLRNIKDEGFDDKILSMYARGMTNREIQGHLEEIYSVDVSPNLISTVTDEIMPEVNEWRNRPKKNRFVIFYRYLCFFYNFYFWIYINNI